MSRERSVELSWVPSAGPGTTQAFYVADPVSRPSEPSVAAGRGRNGQGIARPPMRGVRYPVWVVRPSTSAET